MSLFSKPSASAAEQNDAPELSATPKRSAHKSKRKSRKDQVIRIEELEQLLAEQGDDVDPETVVSMYMPYRRAHRWGAALLRLDKLQLALLCMALFVTCLFILAFMQEKMGNFTINLNRLELYRKGIAIDASGDFDSPTARLTADTVQDATNISVDELPENIDDIDGTHNGKNYMAYTYYLRNAGKEDVGYKAIITLDSYAKGAEDAVRVAVWRNGERTVYAEPSADGTPEDGCVNFESHDVVCTYTEEDFLVGNVDKYTIVIWMEGDDPECVDSIVGGSVEFSMNIESLYEDNTSLLYKFVEDIIDTLTGDKSINAAGTDAPNYYNSGDVTWDTRLNQ